MNGIGRTRRGLGAWAGPFAAWLSLQADAPVPVSLTASPRASVPGATIVLEGSTGIDASGASTVKLLVQPPNGAPVTLAAPLTAGGEFRTSFRSTQALGTYQVKATSPGGRGSATASFVVLPPAGAFQAFEKEAAALQPVIEQGLDRIDTLLAPLPESPDKAQTQKKLEELKQRFKTTRQKVQLGQLVKPLQEHLSRFPAAGGRVAPLFEDLGRWEDESRQQRVRIQEELLRSGKSGERCEIIDQAIEAVNLVSFLLNLFAMPVTLCANFAGDLLTSKVADAGAGDAGGVALKTTLNLLKLNAEADEGLTGVAKLTGLFQHRVSGVRNALGGNCLGLAFDLSNLFLKGYYGKFCERLEGKLAGKMVGTVYQGRTPYWKFSVGLKGKLVLRYAKPAAPSDAIRVKGQLIGFGTDFYVYEDIVHVLFAQTVRENRAITFHKVTTPAVNIALEEWNLLLSPQGAIPQTLLSPTSFYIPVEGDLVKDTLTLRIQPARFDFNENLTTARALYFLIGPRGHEFINNPLPYKNARFILTRAMEAEVSGTAKLKVSVDSAAKSTRVAGEFKREFRSDDGSAEATYTLSVKACNPPCLQ